MESGRPLSGPSRIRALRARHSTRLRARGSVRARRSRTGAHHRKPDAAHARDRNVRRRTPQRAARNRRRADRDRARNVGRPPARRDRRQRSRRATRPGANVRPKSRSKRANRSKTCRRAGSASARTLRIDAPTLFVTHDAIVRVALLDIAGRPLSDFWKIRVENAAYAIVEVEGPRWTLVDESINAHLAGDRAEIATQAL